MPCTSFIRLNFGIFTIVALRDHIQKRPLDKCTPPLSNNIQERNKQYKRKNSKLYNRCVCEWVKSNKIPKFTETTETVFNNNKLSICLLSNRLTVWRVALLLAILLILFGGHIDILFWRWLLIGLLLLAVLRNILVLMLLMQGVHLNEAREKYTPDDNLFSCICCEWFEQNDSNWMRYWSQVLSVIVYTVRW